ncbi:MAG: CAP domain-containing protein [Chitinophagaceae bacterium]
MKTKFLLTSLACLVLFVSLVSFLPSSNDSLVDNVLTYTNKFRKSRGLPALEMRGDLNTIAQKHTKNMATGKTRFGHDGFDNREAQARKLLTGSSHFAENVAYGSTTGKDVVEGWKKSSGHRRNLLGSYKYIGIGVATNRKGIIYYTQIFVD